MADYRLFDYGIRLNGYSRMSSEKDELKISLGELSSNPELLAQLAYPSGMYDYAIRVFRELNELGIDSVYVMMKPRPSLKLIGKGYRGVVLKASWKDTVVAAKILRVDSMVQDLVREAKMMKLANSVEVGPRLLGYSSHVIVMEYVQGVDLDKWLEQLSHGDVDLLRRVLGLILMQARRLDRIHLDHGELSNARGHITVKEHVHPTILDFGKASVSRRPKNVTSIMSYFMYGPHRLKILEMLGVNDFSIRLLRIYKEKPCEESFIKVVEALKITKVRSEYYPRLGAYDD